MTKFLLPRVHLATEGQHIASDGTRAPISEKDLLDISLSHDDDVHSPPVVLGHTGDDPKRVPKNDKAPRFGTPRKLYVEVDPQSGKAKLYGDLVISPEMAKLVTGGYYPSRSISFYQENSPLNPTPGIKHLRHIAALGGEVPAIKGLEKIVDYGEAKDVLYTEPTEQEKIDETTMVELTEEKKTKDFQEATIDPVKQLMDTRAGDFLTAILQEGDAGHTGEIVSYDPTPSADNNYLLNADSGVIAGKFTDESGEVYDFTINTKSNTKSFAPVVKTEATDLSEADLEMLNAAADEVEKNFREGMPIAVVEEEVVAEKDLREIQLREELDAIKLREMQLREELGEGKGNSFPDEYREDPAITEMAAAGLVTGHDTNPRALEGRETEAESQMAVAARKEGLEKDMAQKDYIEKENIRMREQIANLTETVKMLREDKLAKYVERAYSEGRLIETKTPKKDVIAFMKAIDSNEEVISFSEGSDTREGRAIDFFRQLLDKIEPAVNFGEMTGSDDKYFTPYKPSSPGNVAFDSGTSEVFQKAVDYAEKNGLNDWETNNDSFMKAVRAVSS